MSEFTNGKWEIYTHVIRTSFRVLATIRVPGSDIEDIAYIPVIHGFPEREGQANARLIAAAPKMYELLNSICNYINELENIMPHFPDALSLFAKNGNQLLARIDGKEAPND